MIRRFKFIYKIHPRHPKACALAGVFLVILIVPLGLPIQNCQTAGYLIQYTDGLYPMFQAVKVLYVAANETSQEIFFKLYSYGTLNATIERVLVNGKEVTTINSLPLTLGSFVDYGTVIFKYDGSWEDTIQVKMETGWGSAQEEYNIKHSVDLQDASQNSINAAYPSETESQKAYQMQHRWEIFRTSLAESFILAQSIIGLAAFLVYEWLRK